MVSKLFGFMRRSSIATDPVCGMEIDTRNPPGGSHQHEGETYYFLQYGLPAGIPGGPAGLPLRREEDGDVMAPGVPRARHGLHSLRPCRAFQPTSDGGAGSYGETPICCACSPQWELASAITPARSSRNGAGLSRSLSATCP